MTRCSSSRVLLLAIAFAIGGCASARVVGPPPHVIANRLVDVTLADFDMVSFVDVDLHTALDTRDAVEIEFQSASGRAGHPRWFFYAFDGTNLDFVVATYEPSDRTPRYVALRRLRVKRSPDAERELGVAEVVREYEIGVGGVRAGMSSRQVMSVAGRAEVSVLRTESTFDLLYPTFCVRIAQGRVEHVWRRDLCS